MRAQGVSRFFLFLLAGVFFLQPRPVLAANIYCADDYATIQPGPKSIARNWPKHGAPKPQLCGIIEIEGVINPGDADRFKALLRDNHPYVNGVQLNSVGGNVVEAIRIGRLLRGNLLTTLAPLADRDGAYEARSATNDLYHGNLSCLSSCFLIWSAGVQRTGGGLKASGEPRIIGLHRPTSDAPEFTALPPDQAAKTYLETLKAIRAYLEEMELPRNYVEAMTDTSSRGMRFLTNQETDDLEFPPSIIEPLLPVCGPEPDRHEADGSDAYADKAREWRHCWQKRMNNFRDDLPAARD